MDGESNFQPAELGIIRVFRNIMEVDKVVYSLSEGFLVCILLTAGRCVPLPDKWSFSHGALSGGASDEGTDNVALMGL